MDQFFSAPYLDGGVAWAIVQQSCGCGGRRGIVRAFYGLGRLDVVIGAKKIEPVGWHGVILLSLPPPTRESDTLWRFLLIHP
jgi:hypothetical protein